MDKKELVAEIAARAGTKKGKVENVLDALLSTIGDRLSRGESVSLPRFGTFGTGGAEPPEGGAATAPVFTPASELQTRMTAQQPAGKSGKAWKPDKVKAGKDPGGKPAAVKAVVPAAKSTAKKATAKKATAKKATAKKATAKKATAKKAALRPRQT